MRINKLLIIGIFINLFIWMNSLIPGNISSEQSGFIVNILYPAFKSIIDVNTFSLIIRKLAHFTQFMLLIIVFTCYYRDTNKNNYYLIAFIHGLLVAVIDETIQIFIPGRAGLISDVLIDLLGVITGIILVYIYNKFRNKGDSLNGE